LKIFGVREEKVISFVLVLVILEKFVLHSENIKNNCEKI